MNARPVMLRQWSLLFCLLVVLAAAGSAVPSYAGLESSLERGLGSQIARELEAESGVVNDPVLTAWVNGIGRKLADAANRKDVSYSFKILDSEDVNAMAVPGGYVYVTKGLLRFARSEDEIASVLGHEVGHVAARHSMQQIKAQIIGSLILSVFKNKKYSSAVGGAKLAGLFAMLKFSRDNEREADILGVEEAARSGYDPRRMMDFFNRMDDKDKTKVSRLESYFLTHPPFSERLATLSKQPEMQETGENAVKAADGLAQRKLYEEARECYLKALKDTPNMPQALAGLERLPAQEAAPVRKKMKKAPANMAPPEERVQAIRKQLTDLEKRRTSLEKQMKSAVSNLSFASNMISDYDYMNIRVFQVAVDAVNTVAKGIASVSNADTSAKDSLDELVSLSHRLSQFGAEADGVRSAFPKTSEHVLSVLETQVPKAETSAKHTEQACRSVEFAVRQLVSTLAMPRPTEVGAAGLVETQLLVARKNATAELNNSRNVVMNLEGARSELIRTRINLQSCAVGPSTRRAYAERAARYFGVTTDAILAASPDLGDASMLAYEGAAQKASGSETKKDQKVAVDYDSANILLGLLSWDIDREQKAAERQRGNK